MHTQLYILGVLIFVIYYVGMKIRQPISTEAQIWVGYHILLGSHREKKKTKTPESSLVSFRKDHSQWAGGRKRTLLRRWQMIRRLSPPAQWDVCKQDARSVMTHHFLASLQTLPSEPQAFALMTILTHHNEIQPCWGLQHKILTLLSCAYWSLHWRQDKDFRSVKAKLKLEYYSSIARGSCACVLLCLRNSITHSRGKLRFTPGTSSGSRNLSNATKPLQSALGPLFSGKHSAPNTYHFLSSKSRPWK